MNRKRIWYMAMVFGMAMILVAGSVGAEDIKTRMRKRLPVIVKLKQQGIIGEDMRGYLAYIRSEKPHSQVVAAENEDRRTVYTRIARQQGVPLEKVERLRAIQIVQKSPPGFFLQKSDGTWYQK